MAEASPATMPPLKSFLSPEEGGGLAPPRQDGNDVIRRASAPNLTPTSLHDGNQYRGL